MDVFHKKPVTNISEVAIRVSSLDQSLIFYKKILGLHASERTENRAKLTADGNKTLVTLIEVENAARAGVKTTGLYHFALLLPNRDYLAQFLQHIIDNNIPFGASDHHVSEAIYLEDPDGNGIEVYADRPSDSWSWVHERVTMATERIDADDLLAQKTQRWDVMPPNTVLGHLHLHVNDLDEAKKYFTALGFSVVNEFHGAVFMADGKYHHHIAFNIWNGRAAVKPEDHYTGLHSFTIEYKDAAVRKRVEKKLQLLNVKLVNDSGSLLVKASPFGKILLKV